MSQFNSRVYLVPVDGGAPRALVDRPGMNTGVSYSPDGNWIAFQSTGGRVAFLSTWGLHIVRASEPGTGEIRDLGAKTEAWAGQYVWSADSRSLVQVPGEGTGGRGEHMFEQPLWRVSIEDATIDALTPGRFVQFQPGLSRDGRWLAYRSVEPRTMGDIEVMDLDTRQRTRVTDVNPELRGRTLGTLEPIRWTSFDGMEIWGLLLTPPGYRASTGAGQTPGPSAGPPRGRLPLVVYCHGGPIGGFSYGLFPQFMHRPGQIEPYPVEAMAAEGMAVLMPMPRGGSGYGEAGFRTIVHAWGVDDFKDIMAGVDHLVSIGVADPERLGVMGASYGGYMTSWIVTQTTRFKAASTGASLTDLAGMFYLSDAGDPIAEYFGLPWEHPDRYRAHSPITHAGNVTTPLLIQHGENDRRVPVTQARQFYEALKRRNKIVELEIYPRAGHVVYEPVLEREQMRRNLAWFTRWLTP
jgi:dipeptidyl aminopeptidase/acylaminoacyl peptidase